MDTAVINDKIKEMAQNDEYEEDDDEYEEDEYEDEEDEIEDKKKEVIRVKQIKINIRNSYGSSISSCRICICIFGFQ